MNVLRAAAAAALLCAATTGPAALAGERLREVPANVFVRGADLSSLPQVEAAGGRFHDRAGRAGAVEILRSTGFSGARLRLWHSPPDGACGLAATLGLARRLHDAGLPLLLDIHYSDTWADPAKQTKPAAWARADFAALRDSVRVYTREVIATFREAGVMPECVQLGNEIGNGLLWPEGRLKHGAGEAASWSMVAALLRDAEQGAREGAGKLPLRLMLHYENGGSPRGSRQFFDGVVASGVEFDAIGLSYYPWWHGSLDSLAANITQLRIRFGRDVMIVETGYPFSLRWWDGEHNLVGVPSQLTRGYPATPAGQRDFMHALLRRARRAGAAGAYYWEPAWIATPRGRTAWENVALFDSSGAALPALREFGRGR